MAIITVLASLATVGARNAVTLSREATLKEDLFRMRDAIDQYYADKGKYPADLQALVTDQYMREVPVDPISRSRDSWQTIPAEPDPANPSADPGIFNVKSGARRHLTPGTDLLRVLGNAFAGDARRSLRCRRRHHELLTSGNRTPPAARPQQRAGVEFAASPAERLRLVRGFAQWRAC